MDLETFRKAAGISLTLASKWYPHVSEAMRRYGIVTPTRQAAFIAQIGHESASFTRIQESFNYSAEGLRATFGKRISYSQAAKLGRQANECIVPESRQIEIADLVYGSRYGNGENEGWRYRGRGLKQITFKDNYAACGKALGLDLVRNPDLLLVEQNAALSAGWFWHANDLSGLADTGDFVRITKVVNGGTNGLSDRQVRWAQAKSILLA